MDKITDFLRWLWAAPALDTPIKKTCAGVCLFFVICSFWALAEGDTEAAEGLALMGSSMAFWLALLNVRWPWQR